MVILWDLLTISCATAPSCSYQVVLKWPSYHDSKIKININQRTLNSRPNRTCTFLFTRNSEKQGIEKREEFGSRRTQENIFGETHLRKFNLGSVDLCGFFWTTNPPPRISRDSKISGSVASMQAPGDCPPILTQNVYVHPNRHKNEEAKQHITTRITYKNKFVRDNLLHRLSHNYLANISLLTLLNTMPNVRTISK